MGGVYGPKKGFLLFFCFSYYDCYFFVGHRGCHIVCMGFHQWKLKVGTGGGLGWASFFCALCLFTCQAKKALMGPTYIDLAEC